MNTGTVSANASAPTYSTVTLGYSFVTITASPTNAGTLLYDPVPTAASALDATKNSTLPPGGSAILELPQGINRIAFASTGGAASADIALSKKA